ncbi:hypothetical protein N185_32325 [Sinorhizobium sp. GW3]|nr:hypothetical protein N185_32325 [Sinorhizobium sp. GW3]
MAKLPWSAAPAFQQVGGQHVCLPGVASFGDIFARNFGSWLAWRPIVCAVYPLAQFCRFATQDLEEARLQVAKTYCDHSLTPMVSGQRFDAWQTMATLGSIAIGAMGYGAEVEIDPGALGEFYMMMLPYQGQADVSNGSQRTIASSSDGAILNPDGRTFMRWNADCATIMLRIDRKSLEDQLSGMLDAAPVRDLRFDIALPFTGGGLRLCTLARLLVDQLETVRNARQLRTTNLYTSLLLASLIEQQPNNFSPRLASRTAAVAPRQVRVVEDFIEANADRDISLDELIAMSGVSGRALFDGFRKFRGTTPFGYLRFVRMKRVREGLEAARPGETVTLIASQWGFHQLGRFAVQYRKIFGEQPSETLRNSKLRSR